MTSKEAKALKEWNIAQGDYVARAEKAYSDLRKVYLKLNGSVSCSYIDFICEIVNCKKTTRSERAKALNIVIRYFMAQGRYDSLGDYLSIAEDNV